MPEARRQSGDETARRGDNYTSAACLHRLKIVSSVCRLAWSTSISMLLSFDSASFTAERTADRTAQREDSLPWIKEEGRVARHDYRKTIRARLRQSMRTDKAESGVAQS